MSWIFGYFGNNQRVEIKSPDTSIHSYQDSNLIIHSGGNNKTIFFKSYPNLSSCWSVAGVGLLQSGDGYKILDANGWENYLSRDEININEINGHFIAVKYSDNEIKIFTDEIGLRDIYLVKLPDGFGFTTRIDWLKYFINIEIDLKEFGSRWLLYNQVSGNCFIKCVKRIVSASARIKKDILKVEENLWQPDFESAGSIDEFDTAVKKLVCIDNKKTALSLSGGLDSRLLLSYLVNKNPGLWETHTFGDPNHPDSKIAQELLSRCNLQNEIIDDVLPSNEKLIALIKNYAVQSVVTNPVSSVLNLRFYDKLEGQNNFIIDGGFGEIWRRQFANKLLILGRKSLLQKNAGKICNLLKHSKANIFSDEAINEMEKGAAGQIENLLMQLPDAKEFGSANWVDLFSIRTRLPNSYSPEQIRVDQYIISFMPFVQKTLLKLLFNIENNYRSNGKLFRQLIKHNSIQLSKLPLVKGNNIHPFNSSSFGVKLRSRIKNYMGIKYRSNKSIEFFKSLKEFINDVVASSEIRNCEFYDQGKIKKLAADILIDEKGFNPELDWFLSFELFRQGITK